MIMGRVCDRQGMKSEKNDRFAELRKLRQSRKDKKSSPQKNARTKPSTSVELKSNSEDEEDDNDQNTSKKNTSKRGNSSISFSSPSKNVNDFTKG